MSQSRAEAQDRVLRHPVRALLQARLEWSDEPIPMHSLARSLNLTLAKVRFHARALAACGLAVFREEGVAANPN